MFSIVMPLTNLTNVFCSIFIVSLDAHGFLYLDIGLVELHLDVQTVDVVNVILTVRTPFYSMDGSLLPDVAGKLHGNIF